MEHTLSVTIITHKPRHLVHLFDLIHIDFCGGGPLFIVVDIVILFSGHLVA